MKSTISHAVKLVRYCNGVEIDNETDVVYTTGVVRTFVTKEWYKDRIPNTVLAFLASAKTENEKIDFEQGGKQYTSNLTWYLPSAS